MVRILFITLLIFVSIHFISFSWASNNNTFQSIWSPSNWFFKQTNKTLFSYCALRIKRLGLFYIYDYFCICFPYFINVSFILLNIIVFQRVFHTRLNIITVVKYYRKLIKIMQAYEVFLNLVERCGV